MTKLNNDKMTKWHNNKSIKNDNHTTNTVVQHHILHSLLYFIPNFALNACVNHPFLQKSIFFMFIKFNLKHPKFFPPNNKI